MSGITIGIIGVLAGLALIALRVPIAVSLGLVSFLGIIELTNVRAAWGIITAVPFNFIGNWSFTAVPMFLLMGYVCTTSGMTTGLFRAMRVCLSRLPGGLAIASVGACSMFAAASGSSVATASAMARIAVPEMLRHNYNPGLSTGVIAASGTLGSLIPPSILMVLYGVYAEVSIGKLFMAGFLPGLLSAVLYVAMIISRVKFNPELAGEIVESFSAKEKWEAIREVWALPALIVFVLGGIFAGFFTPTEAGAIAVAYSLIIGFFVHKELKLKSIPLIIHESVIATSVILLIICAASAFGYYLTWERIPIILAEFMTKLSSNPLAILLVINIFLLILGMFVEGTAALILLTPILVPITNSYGIDPVHFGIVFILNLSIAGATPPVGTLMFTTCSISNVKIEDYVREGYPFILATIFALLCITYFPIITLFLPNLLM